MLILISDIFTWLTLIGNLRTIVLRPTMMFGEEDKRLIPAIIQAGNYFDKTFYRMAGYGGRHQVAYAGNL